jgi:hypothetical protein
MIGVKRGGAHRSRRFVFRNYDSMAEIEEIARAADWSKGRHRPADPDRGVAALTRWELFPGLRVEYTQDLALESAFSIAVSSLGEELLGNPVTLFSAYPGILDFEELLAEHDATESPDSRSVAVTRLGLGAPLEVDRRFSSRIEQCAFSADDVVREGALWGIIYSEWADVFRETLHRIAKNDSDPFLRDLAGGALTAMDRVVVEGGA